MQTYLLPRSWERTRAKHLQRLLKPDPQGKFIARQRGSNGEPLRFSVLSPNKTQVERILIQEVCA